MKKILPIVLLIILVPFILTACYKEYTGDHPELYTVAINSLLWTNGYTHGADFYFNSEIEIIDKDKYGRVMFTYNEEDFAYSDIAFTALVVCQNSNKSEVYYYEDVNFIVKKKDAPRENKVTFEKEEIEQLKAVNDWNSELKLEKCVKKEIAKDKVELPFSEEMVESIYKSLYSNYLYGATFSLTYDNYGRYICYGVVTLDGKKESDGSTDYDYIVLLFQPDMTYSVYVPDDFYNYQKGFAQFKAEHDWNQPLSSDNS